MKLAEVVEVERTGGVTSLRVDGEEFPWCISAIEGVSTTVGRDRMPSVTIELVADKVLVVNALEAPSDGS